MNGYGLLIFLALLVTMSFPAWSCEPCTPLEKRTMLQSVEAADLVIIGRRHNPPWFFNDNNNQSGPKTIKIVVDKVLKGNIDQRVISAFSWYGMCGYGVVLFKETALLLLQKGTGDNPTYARVNPTCGGDQFKIIDNQLTKRNRRGQEWVDEPFMSMDDFVKNHIESKNK